jgi:hypothetical protein
LGSGDLAGLKAFLRRSRGADSNSLPTTEPKWRDSVTGSGQYRQTRFCLEVERSPGARQFGLWCAREVSLLGI